MGRYQSLRGGTRSKHGNNKSGEGFEGIRRDTTSWCSLEVRSSVSQLKGNLHLYYAYIPELVYSNHTTHQHFALLCYRYRGKTSGVLDCLMEIYGEIVGFTYIYI